MNDSNIFITIKRYIYLIATSHDYIVFMNEYRCTVGWEDQCLIL